MQPILKIIRSLSREIVVWPEYLICGIPGTLGRFIRHLYFSLRLKQLGERSNVFTGLEIVAPKNICIGENFIVFRNCSIQAPDRGSVNIGHNVSLNSNVLIDAGQGGRILIGNNCLIGPNCVLRAADHVFDDPNIPIRQQGHRSGMIELEEDVWLGSNVVVTRSVKIGRGSVVGAHSVVTHDLPPYSIAVGVPARRIKGRQEALPS
jgi:galactoside O-acetyltransferase